MFPKWAKEIANKEPTQRTEEDVRALVRLLRHLKGFRKYSPQIQQQMCKALRYDRSATQLIPRVLSVSFFSFHSF